MSAVLRFTLLACGISWLVAFPLTVDAPGVGSVGFPSHLRGLAALGPFVAAWVMHRSSDPAFRVRDLYRRRAARGAGRLRTILLTSIPLLFLALALVAAYVIDGATPAIAPLRSFADPAVLMQFVVVCVVYGFGEEPGWRGWLLPRLQERHNALRSTLIVAVIWAVWHAPFLVPGVRSDGAGGLFPFFIGLLAAAFWLTFVFNSTGGSVLAASVWHMLWNAASLIARPSSTAGTALGVLLAVSGFGLILAFGRRGLTFAGAKATGSEWPARR